MAKEFAFTPHGVGSRGFYLTKIQDGFNTVNKLQQQTKGGWYSANKAIILLLADKLIENIVKAGYPKYQVTAWGQKEVASYASWFGPAPPHSIGVDKTKETKNITIPKKITPMPDVPLQHIPIEDVAPEIPARSETKRDPIPPSAKSPVEIVKPVVPPVTSQFQEVRGGGAYYRDTYWPLYQNYYYGVV